MPTFDPNYIILCNAISIEHYGPIGGQQTQLMINPFFSTNCFAGQKKPLKHYFKSFLTHLGKFSLAESSMLINLLHAHRLLPNFTTVTSEFVIQKSA